MRPIDFPAANIVYVKPEVMTDEEFYLISAHKGDGFIKTVWMPNKEDIDAINAGNPIVVSVAGSNLPPMALFTLDENGEINQ